MRYVMFYGIKFNVIPVDAQRYQQFTNLPDVSSIMSVTVKYRVQRPIWRIPVPFRVVPSGSTEKADLPEGERDDIHVPGLQVSFPEDITCRVHWHGVFRMFLPGESLFFRGGNKLTINIDSCRGIMSQRTRQTKNY